MSITVGKQIKNFKLPSTNDAEFELENFKGKNVILYFYPKDNTPGCTQESCDFRDNHDAFKKANTVVIGVSRDNLKSHDTFRSEFAFPFDLISDADETVCELFDVMKMKNMYGKQVRGIERSTFLIDAEGKLVKEWRKVKVPGHVTEVLTTVNEL